MKIALVDDSKNFTEIVRVQVKNANIAQEEFIEFYSFNDPETFLELMKTENVCQFDILIIDIIMPKLNGFEVRKKLKQMCPNLKCFLISADIYKEEYFGEYQSIISKNTFSLKSLIDNYKFVSRFMNNLEIDLYEADIPKSMCVY